MTQPQDTSQQGVKMLTVLLLAIPNALALLGLVLVSYTQDARTVWLAAFLVPLSLGVAAELVAQLKRSGSRWQLRFRGMVAHVLLPGLLVTAVGNSEQGLPVFLFAAAFFLAYGYWLDKQLKS